MEEFKLQQDNKQVFQAVLKSQTERRAKKKEKIKV